MSKVVSIRLRDDQIARLQRAARQLGRRPSEAAALLLEESLREREFAFIEFRDSPVGRQAYLKGTRLAVWWVVAAVKNYAGGPAEMAKALRIPVTAVQAALAYAEAYREQIQAAIDDQPALEDLKRLLPNLEVIEVDASGA